ncbi:hypothetical protein GCM10022381_20340 [Leifsonia kafniensis]|uniref:PadR family transcriptional regulator n=1 Tax=Leifsonia kafniensis TaxID=475957 RepID=A0ABP7KHF4_9MICO
MTQTLTDGELTILGLLSESPRHGYELEKVIEERGVRNWTALGFSSIYYLLDKLAGRGLIEAIGVAGTGKSRTTFQVTATGHELFVAASLDALAALEPLRARVLVAVANTAGLPDSEVAKRLRERGEAVRAQLAEVRATRLRQQPLPAAASVIFDYSETMLMADAEWTARTLATIEREMSMEKYDVKVARKELFTPSAKQFTIAQVPNTQYLAVDGHGDPNTAPAYAAAVEALYSVAYTLKFESKKTLGRDFVVGPLEGLWRAAEMDVFVTRDKSAWDWTMMISQPDWITPEMVAAALATVRAKKGLPALELLSLITLDEGMSVQILHIGPYDDEAPTLDRLHHEYLPGNGLTFNGDHHEIYLSDARRTAPAKLKTILRQPVRPLAP